MGRNIVASYMVPPYHPLHHFIFIGVSWLFWGSLGWGYLERLHRSWHALWKEVRAWFIEGLNDFAMARYALILCILSFLVYVLCSECINACDFTWIWVELTIMMV